MKVFQDVRCRPRGKKPGTNYVAGLKDCNDCISQDRNSDGPVEVEERWRNVIQSFFCSFEKIHPTTKSKIVRVFGDEATILIVGPTGSGKTSLLNSMLGFSLFPEGTDHTTPVPTVLRRGKELELKALDENGQEADGIPKLSLDESLLAFDLPSLPGKLLRSLFRVDDFDQVAKWWADFWNPAFRAAKDGRCVCIEASIPANWLPSGLRIVDLPGYEGWFPDESKFLHSLVLDWLEEADHALFIMEKTKIFLGGAIQFFLNHTKKGGAATLLVNQMDTFNPYQIQGLEHDGPQAWEKFKDHVRSRLEEEGLVDLSCTPLFFGAARTRFPQSEGDWLEKNLVSEMLGFFVHLRKTLDAAYHKHEREKAREKSQRSMQLSQHLDSLHWKLRVAFSKSLEMARSDFLGFQSVMEVLKSFDRAVDKVEIGVFELLDKAAVGLKLEQAVRSKCVPAILRNFEKATELYFQDVGERLTEEIGDLLLGLNLANKALYRDSLMIQCRRCVDVAPRSVRASIDNFIEQTGSLSFAGELTKIVFTAGWYSPNDVIRNFAKTKIRPRFEGPIIKNIWHNSTCTLVDTTLESIWRGVGPRRDPVKLLDGEDFPGLQAILASFLDTIQTDRLVQADRIMKRKE